MKKLGILLACAVALSASDKDSVLIRGVDVFPVIGVAMKGVSVLVVDGKIADVGARVVAPRGIRIVEGKGSRLYPGMIDSSTELGLSEIEAERMTVDTGELGEFMPQLKALIAVNPESEHFPVVRANGIASAMTFPDIGGSRTQLIGGQAALIHLDGWTWEEMEIKRDAAVQLLFPTVAVRGADEGGGYAAARRTYETQVAKLTEFFEQARQYQKERTANLPGFKRDLKFEAMIPVLEGKVPVAVTAAKERTIHDAVAFAEKEHIRIVILAPRELGKEGPELKAKKIPVIMGRTESLPENEDAPYDSGESLPSEFYKAGVKIAFGTFSNQFSRNLPYSAARAVAYGLPYEEALKAVTINAAEIWGVGDKTGSIEKGKWADLMLTTGDPLEVATQIKAVYIQGKEVDLSNKQTRLYQKYLNRP